MEYTIQNTHGILGKKITECKDIEVSLAGKDLFKLEGDQRSVRILCTEGTLWITLSGDPHDHILEAGQMYTVSRRGNVILSGLPAARARVLPVIA